MDQARAKDEGDGMSNEDALTAAEWLELERLVIRGTAQGSRNPLVRKVWLQRLRAHDIEVGLPLIRRVQEMLYRELIDLGPIESVRDGWHEATCHTCSWSTTGAETVAEEAAYEHVGTIHMARFEELVTEVRAYEKKATG
jgi:hypothetical protein